jgi:hypothetical protein
LETGFVPFAEKGRKITKASLIVRLEQELEDVERQLAGISEIRTDNFYKERDRSRTPSASSRGSSRSSGLYRKNKRPGTAPRSRSANNRLKRIDHSDSDSKKKRPQSAINRPQSAVNKTNSYQNLNQKVSLKHFEPIYKVNKPKIYFDVEEETMMREIIVKSKQTEINEDLGKGNNFEKKFSSKGKLNRSRPGSADPRKNSSKVNLLEEE